jgi:uncharacterized protein involved in type VI secretion and phage assembly
MSRLHLDAAAPEILRDSLIAGGLDDSGFRLELDRAAYPKRELSFQLNEDLLAFVMRTLEREGIALRFDPDSPRGTAVMLDSNARFPPLADGAAELTLMCGGAGGDAARLRGAALESRAPKASVTVIGYDWRRPKSALMETVRVCGWGRGGITLTAENFTTRAEGRRLAGLVRDRELWESELVTGVTALPGLAPGMTVTLAGSDGGALDGRWLVTRADGAGRLSAGPRPRRVRRTTATAGTAGGPSPA